MKKLWNVIDFEWFALSDFILISLKTEMKIVEIYAFCAASEKNNKL